MNPKALMGTPNFNNLHTRTQALGLAMTEAGMVFYCSTAGPGVAVKSIWSSLVANNSHIYCQEWTDEELVGMNPVQVLYQPLPQSHYQHMVALHSGDRLLLAVEPHAAAWWDAHDISHSEQRDALLAPHLPVMARQFTDYLNAETDVPVLPEWSQILWDAALEEAGIMPLVTYGDCIGAWLIDDAFDWLELVQDLLTSDVLAFPAPQDWLSADHDEAGGAL